MPGGSAEKFDSSSKVDSYYKITELVSISSVLSGRLDRDNLIDPCGKQSSSLLVSFVVYLLIVIINILLLTSLHFNFNHLTECKVSL